MKRALRAFGITIIWLGIWQGISLAISSELIFPSPIQTLSSLFRLMGEGEFFMSTFLSLLRVLLGYIAGVLLGGALGMLTAFSPFSEAFLHPLRGIIKATPVASFILLVLLWVHASVVSAFTSFLMVLPLVWANVQEGIKSTDAQLLEMAKLFRFGRKKTMLSIYLPSLLPQLLASCATGLGLAWKAGIAAEVIARTAHSIGKNLIESKNYLETADMFAWTAIIIILSMLLERLVVFLLGRIRQDERWKIAK